MKRSTTEFNLIYMVRSTSFSAQASNNVKWAELSVSHSKTVTIGNGHKHDFQG